MFFRKQTEKRTFNDVLTLLGAQKFDVSPAKEASTAGAYRVSKYGCAAEIAPSNAKMEKGSSASSASIVARPGYLLSGTIARIEDRGYQKFLKAGKLEIAATADALRAIHQFTEELKEAAGTLSLYNESLGTTSNTYVYDRVKGREDDGKTGHHTSSVAAPSEDDASNL